MKRFLIRACILIAITLIVVVARVISFNPAGFMHYTLQTMPRNNAANSACFKAKLDHIVKSENFQRCSFLIAGSSMSLDNISADVIQNRSGGKVYNISSWSLKPAQINGLMETLRTDSVRYMLLAFNNWDFGRDGFNIDRQAVHDYIYGNPAKKWWSVYKRFNLNTFSQDWSDHYTYSGIRNHYSSLNFDEYGCIPFEHEGFIISPKRWNAYKDTTGFEIFYNEISKLDNQCKQRSIHLLVAYLPGRPGLLTPKNKLQNKIVSGRLQKLLGNRYVDLQGRMLPLNQFCDGIHLFHDGAVVLTTSLMDSLQARQVNLQ